jgi:hypothetical protein
MIVANKRAFAGCAGKWISVSRPIAPEPRRADVGKPLYLPFFGFAAFIRCPGLSVRTRDWLATREKCRGSAGIPFVKSASEPNSRGSLSELLSQPTSDQCRGQNCFALIAQPSSHGHGAPFCYSRRFAEPFVWRCHKYGRAIRKRRTRPKVRR